MISLTIFWCVIGGLLAMLGAYLIYESAKGKKYTAVGIILFVVGILVAIGAEINLYLNGTTEELMWFLLWTRRQVKNISGRYLGTVVIEDGAFKVKAKHSTFELTDNRCSGMVVIGNIYENSELLEEQ